MRWPVLLLPVLVLASCLSSHQDEVRIPLRTAGDGIFEFPVQGGVRIELVRADLVFGPLYLCPGDQAGELCPTARLEWLGAARVNALDESAHQVGSLHGATGEVRSFMFDYGISSLLTQEASLDAEAVQNLGGDSLALSGIATLPDQRRIRFHLRTRLEFEGKASRGYSLVRKGSTDEFGHSVTDEDDSLTVKFSPSDWLEEFGPEDFPEEGSEIEFDEESSATLKIRQALTAGKRPRFLWSQGDDD